MLAAEENPCRRTYSVGSDRYRFQWSSRESFYQYISLGGIIRHVLLVSSASFDRLLDTAAPTMLIDDSSSAFTWNIPKLRSVGSKSLPRPENAVDLRESDSTARDGLVPALLRGRLHPPRERREGSGGYGPGIPSSSITRVRARSDRRLFPFPEAGLPRRFGNRRCRDLVGRSRSRWRYTADSQRASPGYSTVTCVCATRIGCIVIAVVLERSDW